MIFPGSSESTLCFLNHLIFEDAAVGSELSSFHRWENRLQEAQAAVSWPLG